MYEWAEPYLDDLEIAEVVKAMRSTWIGGNGPYTEKFEKELASRLHVRHALAVCNGTCALMCALQALKEIKYPMRFVVPTLTFFATGATVHSMNGYMRLVDCDRRTWNIKTDLDASDVSVIVTVDVGGLPVDYDELKKHRKFILADSAEALGSLYKGEPVGCQADIHVFSFHSAKVVTTGEGGAITTNSTELYEIMKSIINQGYGKKEFYEYRHERIGFNYRMPDLQAAIGLVQLKRLGKFVRERNEKAQVYKDILGDLVEYQDVPQYARHNYFLFGIVTQKRAPEVCIQLLKEGVKTKQLWIPLHKQKPLARNEVHPNAEYLSEHVVLLPIHNRLSEEDVKDIATKTRRVLREMKK